MRCMKFVVFVVMLFLLFGCSSSYLVDRPVVLTPSHQNNAQELATAALVMAFHGKRWVIEGADLDKGVMRARACRGSYCLTVDAQVAKNGNIEVLRTPGQFVSRKGGRLLKYWMRHLTAAYEKFRIKSPRYLRERVEQYHFPPYVPVEATAVAGKRPARDS